MSSPQLLFLADIILLVHLLFVIFVVVGLVLILVGGVRHWHWVRNPWFRVVHLLAIGVVVLQAWLGMICPLTNIEMALRARAGDAVYTGSFIAHWLSSILYYDLPSWVFVLCYTVFGAVVVLSWYWVRPNRFTKRDSDKGC